MHRNDFLFYFLLSIEKYVDIQTIDFMSKNQSIWGQNMVKINFITMKFIKFYMHKGNFIVAHKQSFSGQFSFSAGS